MKKRTILVTCILIATLLSACVKPVTTPNPNTGTPAPTAPKIKDTVTSASVVNDNAAFEKAISKNGTWIIATLKDLKFDKDLVLDGVFKNGKKDNKGNDIIQRKIALYTQDQNRKVTAKFKLTAPKLTINSPEASIQHGAFIGDLYVSAKDFQLVDTTVQGNVYFTTNEAKTTFSMDDKSSVTGKKELKTK